MIRKSNQLSGAGGMNAGTNRDETADSVFTFFGGSLSFNHDHDRG
jgi:hypothetical protein